MSLYNLWQNEKYIWRIPMKKFRRILSALLAVVMVLGTVTAVGAANVSFTDVSGHWAWTGGQIPYLVEKGVLNGYKQPNGTYMFKPDGEITRAEFIKILDETFGLTATTSINFKDVTANDWFYPYFAKAAAQGYILNYGNYATPNGKITREEAISLLVRYLDLPADERASTSTFADYNSISDNFKDYVLRGAQANLINGIEENGVVNFKPKANLTRAQALTILYRAAGCLFNENAYSRDGSAPAENSVITKGGVTLRGITLNGRNLVSEGASSGTVTYSKCTFNGTLYIRGSANVIFDDCVVDDVVALGGGDVSLLNDTTVDSLTVGVKTGVKVYSGTRLEELTVENGADYSTVSGDGSMGKVTINARGFSSSMVPAEFYIGNNLSASFANTEYSGTSDTQNSFSITPFVTADKEDAYLNLISDAEGELYWYYTNSDYTPSIANFDSYYESTSASGHFAVESGEPTTHATITASAAEKFDYVVLQIQDGNRKYAPVTIANSVLTGTGFTTEPYVTDNTKVKFQVKQGGVVFCYYTNSGTGLSQLEFLDEYSETETALKKEASVTSIKSYSIELNPNYLENYDFVAFMLKAANGQYYTPVILPMGENGFASEPEVTEPGKISFKPGVTGDLYYYYSEDGAIPAAADFKTEYNRAEYGDNMDVKKNTSASIDYDTRYIDEYPYMVLCIREDGEYLQPVSVYIEYSTGFDIEPELRSATRVRFATEESGVVTYYYAKFTSRNPTPPTIEDFKIEYKAAKYKNYVECGRSTETIDIDPSAALKYPYMVFMFTDDDGGEHSPVILALDSNEATGFATNPYVSKIGRDYYLSFKTNADGEVWYFYAPDDATTTPSEFEDEWDDADGETVTNVKAGVLETIELDYREIRDYPYVVIAFYDEEEDEFSYPILIDVDSAAKEDSGSGLTGVAIDGKYAVAEPLFDGRLYWYHTDDEDIPDSDEFYSIYNSSAANDTGSASVEAGVEYENIKLNDEYKYLILCLRRNDEDGNEYMEPVVIDLEKGTTDSTTDGATRNSYGFDVLRYDPRDRVITIEAEEDGTIYMSMTVNGSSLNISGMDPITVKEGKEYEIEYDSPALNIFLNGDVVLYLQLKNADDTFKAYEVPIVE